jgi:glycerol uptake facilitator-like aquaporin
VRRFLRENSLSIFFGVLFLGALIGQAVAGHIAHNHEQVTHGETTISLGRYLTSSAFGQAVMENWQSEYLQFMLFMLATVWFLQRGSPESKRLERAGRGTDREQKVGRLAHGRSPLWARTGGVRTAIYSNSLLIVMAVIFAGAWLAQSLTGWTDYNELQRAHGNPAISWGAYLGTAEFWEATLQNWQSEFLAVGSFAVFAIFLRQRGSPESKPVGEPHESTGVQG